MNKRYQIGAIALLSFSIFTHLSGCKKKHGGGGGEPTLTATDNVLVNGLNITLLNNPSSQSNGFNLTFSNAGKISCQDVSIITTAAYGFVPNNASFIPSPIESSMPQYSCTKNGNNTLTLSSAPPLTEGFYPWVEKFNINLKGTIFTVSVSTSAAPSQLLTRGDQTAMNLDPSFPGCGLRGTVLQRVFDCSKKVVNYAVYVDPTNGDSKSTTTNADGTSDYYTLFTSPTSQNPSLFWFLVACPQGGSAVPQQRCAWLTPIVADDQPALDNNLGSGHFATFTTAMLTGYQKRLLWTGLMNNDGSGYTFQNVNSFTESAALQYAFNTNNPGNGASGTAPTVGNSVCVAAGGSSLAGAGSVTFFAEDANTRNILSTTSGAQVSLMVPSYPMVNILTGGNWTYTGTTNNRCPATTNANRPGCDAATSAPNQGFASINVPGFSMTNTFPTLYDNQSLWSSSSDGGGVAWFLAARVFSLDVDGLFAGQAVDDDPGLALGARCVSVAWF